MRRKPPQSSETDFFTDFLSEPTKLFYKTNEIKKKKKTKQDMKLEHRSYVNHIDLTANVNEKKRTKTIK